VDLFLDIFVKVFFLLSPFFSVSMFLLLSHEMDGADPPALPRSSSPASASSWACRRPEQHDRASHNPPGVVAFARPHNRPVQNVSSFRTSSTVPSFVTLRPAPDGPSKTRYSFLT